MASPPDRPDRQSLLIEARRAARQAYAPYSRFRVGAVVVVETASGPRVVTGANVENASYGLTVCAERAALSAACALVDATRPAGERMATPPTITHIAIACIDADDDASAGDRMPCGACRQWIAELAPNATISVDGVAADLTLDDLLPHAFRLTRRSTDSPSE